MSITRDEAQTILTPKQFDAWDLHERGMSHRAIAQALGISRPSVKDRIDAARHNIRKHQHPEAA